MMYDFLKDKIALYIENDVDILENISKVLSDYFDTFYTALDAEKGCKLFLEYPIDVILIDTELPTISGLEVIKKIRSKNKEIPIVIISAYTKTDYLLEAIALKIEQYIVRPVTSKKLYALLDRLNSVYLDKSTFLLTKGVIVDVGAMRVIYDDANFTLTEKELHFLMILSHSSRINYEEINDLWDDSNPTANAIRSFIKHLRKKLPKNILKNRSGYGYVLEPVL